MSDVRRTTDAELQAAGWAAWSRDDDGLLCTCHAPFERMNDWKAYVLEETARGYRVFYPPGDLQVEERQ